jgi:bifunctional non-homologous end joining protein LigD
MAIAPIIPAVRREPFDDPQWSFELKFDGFRGIADIVNGRMISKRGNRMKRFETLLTELPADCILDGEIVALDEAGRPRFHDLMFSRRAPVYVSFDVLVARGEDVRSLPLAHRMGAHHPCVTAWENGPARGPAGPQKVDLGVVSVRKGRWEGLMTGSDGQ